METSFPFLPPEIEAAVAAQHGGPVAVPSRQGEHIVMSMAAYLEMMGINSEEQFKQSVAELRISLAQADAGDTMSLEEARQVLTEKIWHMTSGSPGVPSSRSMNRRGLSRPTRLLQPVAGATESSNDIETLQHFPLRHGLAPEAAAVGIEVRQMMHGVYRILYTVDANVVTIHGIRHGARRPLRPDEIPQND